MSGMYKYKGEQKVYRIINESEPMILPEVVFNEIIKKISSKENKENKSKNIKKSGPAVTESDLVSIDSNERDNELLEYLKLLNSDRCYNYSDWYKVATILYNEKGSFKLFNEWSKNGGKEKYSKSACLKLWSLLSKNRSNYKIGTLLWMINIDNKEGFINLCKIKCKKELDELYKDNINDNIIAKIFYNLFPYSFKFDSERKKDQWYSLNKYGIYKVEDSDLLSARKVITTDYADFIVNDYKNRYNSAAPGTEKDNIAKKYSKLIKYIMTSAYQDAMIKQMKIFYQDATFSEKIDTINPYLLAFENGVFDLNTGKLRNALPDEYISITTGYEYDNEINEEADDLILEKLHEIIPDNEEFEYIMTKLSFCLIGENINEELFTFYGEDGRNGKGIIFSTLR